MNYRASQIAELIPINLISVVNTCIRNRRAFEAMIDSIAELGLKRPITVAKRDGEDGLRNDLVCCQGRLEAFQELGQGEIPAIVITASDEDGLIMSLVENLARRHHKALDLLRDINGLKNRGYSDAEIARKNQSFNEICAGRSLVAGNPQGPDVHHGSSSGFVERREFRDAVAGGGSCITSQKANGHAFFKGGREI